MNILRESIDKAVKEAVGSIVKEMQLRKIVSENIRKYVNEADNSIQNKRKNVMAMLDDDKFNHAELMRHLYHPKDKSEEDTYRSLFSKKATGKPDADGAVRHFSDEEINSLYELLRER